MRKPATLLRLGIAAATLVSITALLCSFGSPGPDDPPPAGARADGKATYKWYPPQVPSAMTFAGERVPLDRFDVREALDRELLVNYYGHSQTLYAIKLSTRYFPMIEARLKAAGVPDDFKYLCVAESHLQNQTSRAGAVGFWQFMPATAPSYGLEVGGDVDERYHVLKSTDAACRYLQQAYTRFGSWTAAAASYNCGMGGYSGATSFQGTSNYYDLQLPEETMRYVFRILALKYIIGGAKTIGFVVEGADAYKPYSTRKIEVSSSIPALTDWARAQGTTYKMVKLLNPWLRSRALAVKAGKTYTIEVPAQ